MRTRIIDGNGFRTWKNVDFTDGASHEEISQVPEGWIYLDRDYKGDREYGLTVVDAVATREALLQGKSEEEAWKAGAEAEGKLRAERFPGEWKRKGNIVLREFGRADGVALVLLSGMGTRTGWDIDFVEGGNTEVYAWLRQAACTPCVAVDDSVFPGERPVIFLHELWERRVMERKGIPYSRAHDQANRVELLARRDPAALAAFLKDLGWEDDPQALSG